MVATATVTIPVVKGGWWEREGGGGLSGTG